MDMMEFLDEFRAEAGEHLRALDAQLLQLERDPADSAPIREMFLSAHTIKGGAAMMELEGVRGLAHAMEDVLGTLRDGRQPFDRETADLLFRTLDLLRELVERSLPGEEPADGAVQEMMAALRGRIGKDAAAPPAGAPEADQRPPLSGRVLLVDDSATVRMMNKIHLADAGFEVETLGDGTEALTRALEGSYDLIVTSIEVRGLRGLELAAALRSSTSRSGVPIILMSSDDNSEHRRRASDLGVGAYIRKGSFGQLRLAEAARELLAR